MNDFWKISFWSHHSSLFCWSFPLSQYERRIGITASTRSRDSSTLARLLCLEMSFLVIFAPNISWKQSRKQSDVAARTNPDRTRAFLSCSGISNETMDTLKRKRLARISLPRDYERDGVQHSTWWVAEERRPPRFSVRMTSAPNESDFDPSRWCAVTVISRARPSWALAARRSIQVPDKLHLKASQSYERDERAAEEMKT